MSAGATGNEMSQYMCAYTATLPAGDYTGTNAIQCTAGWGRKLSFGVWFRWPAAVATSRACSEWAISSGSSASVTGMETICANEGLGHVGIPMTAAETSCVTALASSQTSGSWRLLVNGKPATTGTTWTNGDGEALTYTNWATNNGANNACSFYHYNSTCGYIYEDGSASSQYVTIRTAVAMTGANAYANAGEWMSNAVGHSGPYKGVCVQTQSR